MYIEYYRRIRGTYMNLNPSEEHNPHSTVTIQKSTNKTYNFSFIPGIQMEESLLYIYNKSTFASHAQYATQRAPSSHEMVHKSTPPIRPTDDTASSKTKWRQGESEQPQERGFRARLKIGRVFKQIQICHFNFFRRDS